VCITTGEVDELINLWLNRRTDGQINDQKCIHMACDDGLGEKRQTYPRVGFKATSAATM
jgi:hypothetical protein